MGTGGWKFAAGGASSARHFWNHCRQALTRPWLAWWWGDLYVFTRDQSTCVLIGTAAQCGLDCRVYISPPGDLLRARACSGRQQKDQLGWRSVCCCGAIRAARTTFESRESHILNGAICGPRRPGDLRVNSLSRIDRAGAPACQFLCHDVPVFFWTRSVRRRSGADGAGDYRTALHATVYAARWAGRSLRCW